MEPIQVYMLLKQDGKIIPLAFCIDREDSKYKMNIVEIENCKAQRLLGKRTLTYNCIAVCDDRKYYCILRFYYDNCCWVLCKMQR